MVRVLEDYPRRKLSRNPCQVAKEAGQAVRIHVGVSVCRRLEIGLQGQCSHAGPAQSRCGHGADRAPDEHARAEGPPVAKRGAGLQKVQSKNRTWYFSEKKVEKWKSEDPSKSMRDCILGVENALCAAHLAAAKRYFRVLGELGPGCGVVPTVKGSEGSATP